jgi:hypothetical protein
MKLSKPALCCLLPALALVAAACSSGSKTQAQAKSVSAVATGPFIGADAPAPVPKGTVKDAVAALLSAEQSGAHASSFVLLSDEARSTYKDIHRWTDRRNELPAVTSFHIEGAGKQTNSMNVVVDHTPGLDPFRGLSAATDHETWVARNEHGGWLLDADPSTTLVLPSDTATAVSALAWARAEQTCDTKTARSLQAIDPILGLASAPAQLCGHSATFAAGAAHRVPQGSESQDLIAQYSTDSLDWARAITVTGADHPFDVILAPIGNVWQVVGMYINP